MSLATSAFDASVVIGRFQPFHLAHLVLLHQALPLAPRVFVVLGSAHQARSVRNPWTWRERADCISAALPEQERGKLTFVPVRDYYDEDRWRSHIEARVGAALAPTKDVSAPRVALVGHFKDGSSQYLQGFAAWQLVSVPVLGDFDATAIREAYFAAGKQALGEVAASLRTQVPDSTWHQLHQFAATRSYEDLVREWQTLKHYREAWASAPFPPVFVTADALVTCREHVLLIRRGHAPGRGLLALPGGFIEQAETTLQGAVRELQEETKLAVPPDVVIQSLRSRAVFDHPLRSQRGRTITHVFHFDLGSRSLPEVGAGDDAASVEWIEQHALSSLEDQFCEDHYHILDQFLGLAGAQA